MNNKRKYLALFLVALVLVAAIVIVIRPLEQGAESNLQKMSLRLQWVPQAQFAGFLVADNLGYYEESGLDIEVLPAGPDLKPHVTVAAGTDQFGVGVSNQIISTRSNGVPLVAIAQIFQDSANRYVLKKKNAIADLNDLQGKKIGLWLGGDEVEFLAMLRKEGMTGNDIEIIPQGFSIAPFLSDEYVLSQVTVYNELNLVQQEYPNDSLQVLSPADWGVAIPGDVVFVTETFLEENLNEVNSFVSATLRGWKYAIENPEATIDIVLQYNSELERNAQIRQLKAVINLVTSGAAESHGIGWIDSQSYDTVESILFEAGVIDQRVDVQSAIDLRSWNSVASEIKSLR